jgi:hypothetical protein
MAVPTTFAELSTTAASNPPADTEGVSEGDNQFRQVYAFIRSLYEGSTSGQISFPAVQNTSALANVLDDYEEGSFTPTDASGASLTFTAATGRYTKIGRLVFVKMRIVYPTTVSSADAILSGLPFSSSNDSPLSASLAVGYSSTNNLKWAVVTPNANTITLYAGASQATTNANLSGATIFIGGTYEAAA